LVPEFDAAEEAGVGVDDGDFGVGMVGEVSGVAATDVEVVVEEEGGECGDDALYALVPFAGAYFLSAASPTCSL
jgi:hypothetical protein